MHTTHVKKGILGMRYFATNCYYTVNGVLQFSVSVSGPGLPALLPNENYSCRLADTEGRYNITVPAIAVTEGVNYTCDITTATFNYMGIQSGESSSTPCTLLYFITCCWGNTR